MRTQFVVITSLIATSTMLAASLGLTIATPVRAISETEGAVAALDADAGKEIRSTMPTGWKDFTSAAGNFTVKAPNIPEESEDKDDDGGKSYSFAFYQDSNFYFIRYSDNPQFENNFTLQQIREVLDSAPAAFAKGSGGKILGQRSVALSNHQGIEFDFQIKNVTGTGRAFLVKGRLYMIVGAGEISGTKTFLNSFQLIRSGIK
jgi:hypothetical protein